MKLSREKRSGVAEKGSQFHLQDLVNKRPDLLNSLILEANQSIRAAVGGDIQWVSPRAEDDYLEYQDEEFLEGAGYPQLGKELLSFWPAGGPVWDGLAAVPLKKDDRGGIIILEAKAHIKEVEGPGCGAKGKSRDVIVKSFTETQRAMGIVPNNRWLGKYYQYANRLAHLYFLLITREIPSWLVFLYFVGDVEQNGPARQEGWKEVLEEVKEELALPQKHVLSAHIINVFFDLQA